MNTYPPEPLTPEERELAERIGKLGPHGEPSPALDARILAAAHAAVLPSQARKPKPRWPVAMGLAASVVFAVGVAWQLRPVQQVAAVAEAPAQTADLDKVESAATPAVAASPAPANAQANEVSSPVAKPGLAPPPPAPPAVARVEPTLPAPEARRNAVKRSERPQAFPALPQAAPATTTDPGASRPRPSEARPTAAYSPPPPPAPAPLAMSAPAPAPAMAAEEESAAASADTSSLSESATSSARAASANNAMQSEMKARAAKAGARDTAKETAKERLTLESVEVTGSRARRTDLQVPVNDDTQLAVNDWLERVRTRYGLGDADAARQSLLLFVRDHPRETVPDDLEPLLEK